MLGELRSFQVSEGFNLDENGALSDTGSQNPNTGSYPPTLPPLPLPPFKPVTSDMALKRTVSGGLSSVRIGSSTKSAAVPNVLCHSPAASRPSSPKSCSEADEQVPCFRASSYNDVVYGNDMEIQALSEMYNRPVHIYSYSTVPINIFQGSYDTGVPHKRLNYHQGNHYNSLVDPRQSNIGAGLGFSSLHGKNIDKHQIKAAIKAQQDHQIENALLAEGHFYSDLELTEKQIEQMVMETSRAEYLSDSKLKQVGFGSSSTSGAEPSSSGARKLEDGFKSDGVKTTKKRLSAAIHGSFFPWVLATFKKWRLIVYLEMMSILCFATCWRWGMGALCM